MHALLGLRSSILAFIHIPDGKLHDVRALEVLPPEGPQFTERIAGTHKRAHAKSGQLRRRAVEDPSARRASRGLASDLTGG